MAIQQLGTIVFNEQKDYGGSIGIFPPSLPYRLQFILNDETDFRSVVINTLVAVPIDSELIPDSIVISENFVAFASVESDNYKRCNGSTLENYVQNIKGSNFTGDGVISTKLNTPYWKVVSQSNHFECVQLTCDIKFAGEPILTQPSGKLIPDGKISVFATSSNTGIKYAIEKINFVSDINDVTTLTFQTSNLFDKLFPGLYKLYAKDKHDCITTVTISLKAKEEDYLNTRLFFEYHDTYGQKYRVNIVERDNSSITTEVKPSGNPNFLEWDQNDNIFRRIVGSAMQVELINTTNFEFLSLFDKEDKFYRADFIKDPDGTPLLIWSGFLVTNQYNEPFQDPPYSSIIVFNDGLGELKNIDFRNSAGETITGLVSRFDTLLSIIKKLQIGFNIRIAVDLESETESFNPETQTPLHVDYLDQEAYKDYNCEQVLKDLMFRYNARIHMKDGFFWVQRIVDNIRPFYYLEYTLEGEFVSKQFINNYKLIEKPDGAQGKNFYVESFPRLRLQTGYKRVVLKRPSHARKNVLDNGDFENNPIVIDPLLTRSNIEGWTAFVQGSTSTSFSNFNTLQDGKDDFVLRVFGNSKDSRVYSKAFNITNFKGDRLKFSFSYFLGFNEKIPAVKVKWQVKWGTKYLTGTGDWVDRILINTIHKKSYGNWDSFSVDAESFDELGLGKPGVMQVTIWAADYYPDQISSRFFYWATKYEEELKTYESDYRAWLNVLEDDGPGTAGSPPTKPIEPTTESGYFSVDDYPDDYVLIVSYDYNISGTIVPESSFWEIDLITIETSTQVLAQEIKYWKFLGKLRPEQAGLPKVNDFTSLGLGFHTTYKKPFIDYNNVKLNIYPEGKELPSEFTTTKDNELNFFPEYPEEFITGSLPRVSNQLIGVNPPYPDLDRWLYDFHAKNKLGKPIFRFKRSTSTQFQVMEALVCDEILKTYENNYWILDATIFSKGVLNFTNAIVDLIYPVTDLGNNFFEGKIYLLGGMKWDPKRAIYVVTLIDMGFAQVQKDVDPGESNVDGQNTKVIPPEDPLAPPTQGAFSSGFSTGFKTKS